MIIGCLKGRVRTKCLCRSPLLGVKLTVRYHCLSESLFIRLYVYVYVYVYVRSGVYAGPTEPKPDHYYIGPEGGEFDFASTGICGPIPNYDIHLSVPENAVPSGQVRCKVFASRDKGKVISRSPFTYLSPVSLGIPPYGGLLLGKFMKKIISL